MNQFTSFTLQFFVYCFIGWFIHQLVQTISHKTFQHYNFTYGPYIPWFGFLSFFFIQIDQWFPQNPILCFIFYFLLCLVSQRLIQYLSERFFHINLTNPPKRHHSIYSALILAVTAMLITHPLTGLLAQWITAIPENIRLVISSLLIGFYVLDFFTSYTNLDKRAKQLWSGIQHPTDEPSFAHGLNFYKCLWIFIIASVIGFIIETGFSYIQTGAIQNRQGLLYGPFSQIYGIGAIVMTLALYPMSERSHSFIFVASACIGGAFEVICSLLQQLIFHSISWYYTPAQWGIFGGRTSVIFMTLWGGLGLFFIHVIYPWMSRAIERIPNLQGRFISWILLIILVVDIALSGAAVIRWSQRDAGEPATNFIAAWLDKTYPDSVLQAIYPNMAKR